MSLESAEKTKGKIQANDKTQEENQSLLNADDLATGKNYSSILNIVLEKTTYYSLFKEIMIIYKKSMFFKNIIVD